MSLYSELRDAGVKLNSHESDLYFERTHESLRILDRFPAQAKIAGFFISQVEGTPWIDVPFAFEPWWEKRMARL